jgi:predicted ABC-type ATPase
LTEKKRLRVFAGPNGSGKSTITRAVSQFKTPNGFLLPLGFYINADEIATLLKNNGISFEARGLSDFDCDAFWAFSLDSGLLSNAFTFEQLKSSFSLRNNYMTLNEGYSPERLAQFLARFLRQEMIRLGKNHSYETVFSHHSTLDDIRKAKDAGFKVYFYFVATVSPEINKSRVKQRVLEGGHDVPDDVIEKRYYNSLELLHPAAQLCDEVWMFDNSNFKELIKPVAHFKVVNDQKVWNPLDKHNLQNWFITYYLNKVTQS